MSAALGRVLPAVTATDRIWRDAIVVALEARQFHSPDCRNLQGIGCPWCSNVRARVRAAERGAA